MWLLRVVRFRLWTFLRLLAIGAMMEPFLDSLEMIGGRDVNPLVTKVAEDTFGIKFADIGVFSKQIVAFFEGVDVFAVPVRDK